MNFAIAREVYIFGKGYERQPLPIRKSRSISREHDSVHSVHTTGDIFSLMTNDSKAFGKTFYPFSAFYHEIYQRSPTVCTKKSNRGHT